MNADDDVPEAVELSTAPEPPPAKGSQKPVPVTLITGFLGAGKTTLVRHVLTAPHGLRIAVILNEFGEGVEEAYFQDIKGLRDTHGEWVELDNGCMCCSVKSEFVQALEALLARDQRPDYILIETTGMANPGPVAAALWTDEQVEAGVQLDGIVTVVDALNIDRQLNDPRKEGAVNEAQVQVAYADLILLNKLDLCAEEAIARAEADIRAINSAVTILRTSNSKVDMGLLLNRQGYIAGGEVALAPIAEDGDGDDGEGGGAAGAAPPPPDGSGPAEAPSGGTPAPAGGERGSSGLGRSSLARSSAGGGFGSGVLPASSSHCHSRAVSLSLDMMGSGDESDRGAGGGGGGSCAQPGAGAGEHRTHHDPQIQTVSLSTNQPLALDKLKAFMDRLLWEREVHPEDIYRVKGVCSIHGDDRKHMLQAVYELYNITPSGVEWAPDEPRTSRLVVIGRQLNRAKLDEWFQHTVQGSD